MGWAPNHVVHNIRRILVGWLVKLFRVLIRKKIKMGNGITIITGSGGLVGVESVKFFSDKFDSYIS